MNTARLRKLDAIAAGVAGPAEVSLIPASGHSPHLQARDAVLAQMATFIDRICR